MDNHPKNKSFVNFAEMDTILECLENTEPDEERNASVREYVFTNFPKLLKLVEKGHSIGSIYRQIVNNFNVALSEITFTAYFYQAKSKWEKGTEKRGINFRKRGRKPDEAPKAKTIIEKPVEAVTHPITEKSALTGSAAMAAYSAQQKKKEREFEELAAKLTANQ